jgi:hypothetical protein
MEFAKYHGIGGTQRVRCKGSIYATVYLRSQVNFTFVLDNFSE